MKRHLLKRSYKVINHFLLLDILSIIKLAVRIYIQFSATEASKPGKFTGGIQAEKEATFGF